MRALKDTIIELMAVPEDKCDLNWLKKSLQAAIKLEFSTIPPYLCALWSIDSRTDAQKANNEAPVRPSGQVANSIRQQIAREEMLHFAIVCNLLSAIGGTPALNTPEGVPIYPGPLPGLDNPSLELSLQGLSPEVLQVFLQVEYPEFTPVISVGSRPVSTIGEFYTRIFKEFETLINLGQLNFNKDRQIDLQTTGFFGESFVVENMGSVANSVKTIQRQGEGSNLSPGDTSLTDLAHYYRFAEIFKGRKLAKLDDNTFDFIGDPIPSPNVYPMDKVPAGGYQKDLVSPEVGANLDKFDLFFSRMMCQLQKAWTPDSTTGKVSPDALNAAIGIMQEPEFITTAQKLISTPLPTGSSSGNYGPCFRIVKLSSEDSCT